MKNYFCYITMKKRETGQEGVSFYYSDVKQKLYLRYARFQKGDVSTLVSSKHSKEKLKKLLAKPKDLWIFHCCGFQVLDSYFNRWQMQEVKGSHYQYSNDKKTGKTIVWVMMKKLINYLRCISLTETNVRIGLNEVDYELILEPHFQIRDITSIYRANVFNLAADFGSGTGEKSFPENYLRKLAFFNKFKTLH